MNYERQKYEPALEWLRKAIAQDQPQAHTLLSTMYKEGYGVSVDEAESIRLLGRAAALGDSVAQNEYGIALREGTRLPANAMHAFEWFKKAAAQGDIDGQVSLGIAYAKGTGVSKDVVRGVAWLEICRDENSRDAIRALGWARRLLTPDEVQESLVLKEEIAAGLPK
jgi:hypothetical protein